MAFLSLLSIIQAAVVWAGLAAGMVVCVAGVARGELTVGDAVLFATMMTQLYVPLTFFGSYYRQARCRRCCPVGGGCCVWGEGVAAGALCAPSLPDAPSFACGFLGALWEVRGVRGAAVLTTLPFSPRPKP